ncbi:DUF1257 domain-containing protein [Leptolyngbya sp. 7M]|uniref:DUF1257 domain-containing protein n=1 Tax=Leptolyngbya sp. 7M TaxID=2812896 RepID=UPI001B8BF240|nr:DUF1257 domain-containing protein [Leptolyngbya sp. 7M]QYO65378.1 DUF1257 domain-containing protein [Leptolyngbya sp. 7M]
MTFESQSFANGELLLEALSDIGFTTVTQGKDLPLDGWDKRSARTADIIILRRDVKTHHLLADIGFQRTSSGYVAVIDDMDLDHRLGKDFVVRLQNQYHEAAARKMAKKLGGTLVKERVGKKIKIRVKF